MMMADAGNVSTRSGRRKVQWDGKSNGMVCVQTAKKSALKMGLTGDQDAVDDA